MATFDPDKPSSGHALTADVRENFKALNEQIDGLKASGTTAIAPLIAPPYPSANLTPADDGSLLLDANDGKLHYWHSGAWRALKPHGTS